MRINKKKLWVTIGLFACAVAIWALAMASQYVSISTDFNKINPILFVSGKQLEQIKEENPNLVYKGITADSMQVYVSFEKDTIGSNGFFFKDGRCIRQMIIPKDNQSLGLYVNYLNKKGEEYIQDVRHTVEFKEGDVTSKRIVGQWRLLDNGHWTNIFLIVGEIENPCYFLNTDEELPYWMNKSP